jgi:regulatory protein
MPADSDRAYVAGLKLLATRELAESQLRERLTRRKFESDDVEAALARLRAERALDDNRTAAAYARTEAHVRGRGRIRVLRRLHAMGIAPEVARAAVGDAYRDLDEGQRIEQVLARRLRPGETLEDPKVAARLQRYLIAQGFGAGNVGDVLRKLRRATSDEL